MVLGTRRKSTKIPCGYTIFGEWLYAKHTIFYDNLPDYWLGFDIFNGKEFIFLTDEWSNIVDELDLWSVPKLELGLFTIDNTLERISQREESIFGNRMEVL